MSPFRISLRGLALALSLAAASAVFGVGVYAQTQSSQRDSLVILVSATSAQAVDISGASYRKVIGPARFLHNNTYLLCDTAFWNVDSRFIEAIGHVSLLQDETVLTSDKLTYLIDDDLAQFRGSIVQLEDKDHNTLRTRHLDYNTADSVAVFKHGGAMRDKDGQIIESIDGTYDSKTKIFAFENNVNMFSDTIFVKTNTLDYDADRQIATFGTSTDMWNKDNMLSSEAGWYDRSRELFLFRRNVHLMTAEQESWSDSLYFHRETSDVEMLGNVQITDTTRSVTAIGGRAVYTDSLSSVHLTRKPVIVAETSGQQDDVKDTVYIGAESFLYYTRMMFEVDSAALAESKTRLSNFDVDPVGTYRKKAAEEAAKAAAEEAMNDPNHRPQQQNGTGGNLSPASGNSPAGRTDLSENSKKASEDQTSGKTDVKDGKRKNKSGKSTKAQREKAKKRGKQLLGESSSASSASSPADSVSTAASLSTAISETAFSSDSAFAGLNTLPDSSSVTAAYASDSLDKMISSSDSSFLAVADSSSSVNDSSDFVADSLGAASDSLTLADSLANLPKDSTKVGFLEAMKNVRMFRSDMQMACDSMLYCDLDSLVRMFKDPMLWQEGTRQYAADSISVLIRNGAMDRASLMSDAFISIKEDETHFDQIKGAEMMAYFDADGGLARFDVLGGASALFYLQEHDVLATVNRKESKMLSATFKDGDIERIYYYDTAKSDGYPVVQLSEEERKLKGFNWSPERCPAHKDSVTTAVLRPVQRREYEARPQAEFSQTDIYFPGYIDDIHRQIEVRDSLKAIRRAEAARARELAEIARRDSIAKAISDSLSVADSLALADSLFKADSIALSDSLALADSLAVADSIAVSDSLAQAAALENMTPEQIKARKKAEDDARKAAERQRKKDDRARKKAARVEAREKKWADADSRDAQKKILKDAKKLAKERAHKRKALESAAEQARKDRAVLERYKARYEKSAAAKTAQSPMPTTPLSTEESSEQ